MTRLFLIRHAESEWNAQGRWQGHADPPLTERGRAEVAAVDGGFVERFVAIGSSDLRRARETAEILAARASLGVLVEPDVKEIDVGDWTGLTREEIDRRWPGHIDDWRAGKLAGIPGGEERVAFRRRVIAGLERIASSVEGPVLVVTHATAIGVLEGHLGVHPGVPMPRLTGRWFELAGTELSGSRDGVLRAVSDRVSFASVS